MSDMRTIPSDSEYVEGYSVTMRRDTRTGEYLAFIPRAYRNAHGDRYYMAFTLADAWVELAPAYVRAATRNAREYPDALKTAVDRNLGRILYLAPRLYA